MIIFKGHGGLGIILLLGVPLGIGIPLLIADQMRLFHGALPRLHADSLSLSLVVFGTSLAITTGGWMTWKFGTVLNRREPMHTIYFLPMEFWGKVAMVLGGIFCLLAVGTVIRDLVI
jgi:hypothetical protein